MATARIPGEERVFVEPYGLGFIVCDYRQTRTDWLGRTREAFYAGAEGAWQTQPISVGEPFPRTEDAVEFWNRCGRS